jgi:hypothetical protein
MGIKNRYFRIAAIGMALTAVLQVVLFFVVDPYLASVLSPFYSVWIIIFVVGWRKESPRR